MRRCDVVVVGGGVIGSATAWQLARGGADVVLLDRHPAGHDRGSSHGGSRIFRFAYRDPTLVAMARQALEEWRLLEAEADESLVEVTGGLDLGTHHLLAPIEASLRASGVDAEWVHPGDAADRWPGFALEPDDVVLHCAGAGRILADRALVAFQRVAGASGAEIRHDERVEAIESGTGHVTTDVDEYLAETVVLAAGPWTPTLLRGRAEAEGLAPMVVTREQTFHFPPLDDDLAWPSFVHYRSDAPIVYGLETPGEGIKVAEDHAGAETDPDDRSFEIDEVGRQRLIRYVVDRLPGLDPRPITESTCLYTSTPDLGFVLERRGRLVIGSACSGHGFKFAPLTGRRLAELASVHPPA